MSNAQYALLVSEWADDGPPPSAPVHGMGSCIGKQTAA